MEENKLKFCVVCGRRIPSLSQRRVTCSDFCRAKKKRGFAPYANYTVPPFADLTEFQKEAQKKGMSYGKYVASLTNNKRKEENNG